MIFYLHINIFIGINQVICRDIHLVLLCRLHIQLNIRKYSIKIILCHAVYGFESAPRHMMDIHLLSVTSSMKVADLSLGFLRKKMKIEINYER